MDSTDLSEILGGGGGQPVQQFAPMVTGGGDPFISPMKPAITKSQDFTPQLSILRYSVQGLLQYFAYFLSVVIVSLSTPRTLILQYIPHSYTSGGVVSYTGAAVLGGSALVMTFVLNAVFKTLF
jgi:hypothetical protein